MQIAQYAVLALLTLALAATSLRTLRTARALRRRRILGPETAGCCESLGFVGISAVCSGVKNIEHIENLLGTEYDRYELVVVLDAEAESDAFRNIATHYGLVRVNAVESDELPSARIRALYRSRRRNYRRLVLVDRADAAPYEDLDAGTTAASYDYILPVGPRDYLLPDAVETAAIAISDSPRRVEVLRSAADTPCAIFSRETVIGAGGFSPDILRRIPSRSVLRIRLPLICRICNLRRTRIAAWGAIFLLLVPLFILEASSFDKAVAAAAAATAAALFAAARYTAIATSPDGCSLKTILCYFSRIKDFFRPQKFTVS